MTKRKEALDALERVKANRYRYGGLTATELEHPRVLDIETIRSYIESMTEPEEITALREMLEIRQRQADDYYNAWQRLKEQTQPEVVTVEEFDRDCSKYRTDCKVMADFLITAYPNGIKIVRGK